MRVVVISGSNVGTKTRTVSDYLKQAFAAYDSTIDVQIIDLAEVEMVFADGRSYTEYSGDTGRIAREIMEADALVIGTPIVAYMKAQVVQPYVFVEGADLLRGEIVNHDVLQRLDRLVEDTVVLTQTYQKIREAKDAAYGF